MHEAALAQAALAAPTIVLGLSLRPYSLGHELFLIREASPVLSGIAERIKPKDLELAALICCQSFEECKAMERDRWMGLKLWLWRRRLRQINFERERRAFLDYLESGSLEFPLSEVIKPGRSAATAPPGAPFLLRLHHFLMIRMGKSESEAWNYPLGLAKMRLQAHWEAEGDIDIYNSFDAEADAYAAAEEAKEELAARVIAKEGKCQA